MQFLLTDPRDKSKIFIRKLCSSVMQLCRQLAGYNIFLIPIFSGTLSLRLIRIFSATDYVLVSITPSPLSLESSMELTLKKLPESFVGTLGGIPRAIEYLNYMIRDQPNLLDEPKLLFEASVTKIGDLYSISEFAVSSTLSSMILREFQFLVNM
jgi:hypothetical protein